MKTGTQISAEEILRRRQEIESVHGKWTAHSLRLAEGVNTMDPPHDFTHSSAMWFAQVAEVLLRRPLRSMRTLDVGCLEGGLSLGIGELGGQVVGLEIREASLAKANFARDVLEMKNVEFVQGDMLRLPEYGLGVFDVILCSGTLYHVDAPDILGFLRDLRQSCSGIVIFDTHIAVERREEFRAKSGERYLGRTFVETHAVSEDIEEKKKDLWGSMHNNLSFWLTERSLANFLIDAGFQFVSKPLVPVREWPWQDRGVWIGHCDVERLLTRPRGYTTGRYIDPDPRPWRHEMLDQPIQIESRNPSTRLVADGA